MTQTAAVTGTHLGCPPTFDSVGPHAQGSARPGQTSQEGAVWRAKRNLHPPPPPTPRVSSLGLSRIPSTGTQELEGGGQEATKPRKDAQTCRACPLTEPRSARHGARSLAAAPPTGRSLDPVQAHAPEPPPRRGAVHSARRHGHTAFYSTGCEQDSRARVFFFKKIIIEELSLFKLQSFKFKYSSGPDGRVGRNPALPRTTKRKVTTNPKSINQKRQKTRSHGTLTTMEVKRKPTRTPRPVRPQTTPAGGPPPPPHTVGAGSCRPGCGRGWRSGRGPLNGRLRLRATEDHSGVCWGGRNPRSHTRARWKVRQRPAGSRAGPALAPPPQAAPSPAGRVAGLRVTEGPAPLQPTSCAKTKKWGPNREQSRTRVRELSGEERARLWV